jgi:hypothetical protein
MKSKGEHSLKTINDFKRELETMKSDLKNKSVELG